MTFIKIFIIASILFLLQGCIVTDTTINQSSYKVENPKHEVVQKSPLQLKQDHSFIASNAKPAYDRIYNGSIKGIINTIKYEKHKKTWLYEIKGVDTSNYKLPYARFFYKKKLARHGDLVYVILKNSKLQNLFFINKTNEPRYYERKNNTVDVIHKRNKNRIVHWIALPKVEKVDF